MITQRPKSGGGDGGGGGGGGGHEARQQAPCVYVAGVGPPGSVSPSREFRVSELVSVLEQLLLYPRVDWDVRKLAWVSYICTTVYEYEDHLSKWIPAVKVELPRLAPRPRSRGSGSTAVRRRASRGSVGGDEGWETREYKGVRSSGGIGSNGKDLLVSYLEELRSTAAGQRRWDLHRLPAMPAEGARYGELYGGVARQTEPDDEHGCGEAENTWKDLEMFPDEEELRMLSTAEGAGDEAAAGAASPTSSTSSAISLLPATDTLTNAVPSVLPMNTALVLLSADSAALGVWLGGRLVRHKVLTGYTVRQSAGGSQARRDRRTRGGGGRSVGAALRRAEAVRLWQATAARLTDWVSELSYCDILIRSGDTRVFAQLYEARRPAAPIGPRDPRWEGAGMSVPRPRLRDLFAVYGRLCTGRVKNLLSMNGSESKPPSRG
ncbi:hypothetical protein Vafri_20220 [Volvox africanus]|nr:hypothetical protein Vafri_20220 [Volvox africanus]